MSTQQNCTQPDYIARKNELLSKNKKVLLKLKKSFVKSKRTVADYQKFGFEYHINTTDVFSLRPRDYVSLEYDLDKLRWLYSLPVDLDLNLTIKQAWSKIPRKGQNKIKSKFFNEVKEAFDWNAKNNYCKTHIDNNFINLTD